MSSGQYTAGNRNAIIDNYVQLENTMHKVNELKIWHKAIALTAEIYLVTAHFPKEEIYGLIAQLRRAAVSIASNIAEGAGRNTNNDFKHFLAIANGSSYEIQTQLMIAEKLKFIDTAIANRLLQDIDDLQKMSYRLQQSLLNAK